MSLPAVTKHLQVLERAGLITKTREAQWRPCKLNGRAFKDAADWVEQYRTFWEASFDRLGETRKPSLPKSNSSKNEAKGKVMVAKNKSNEIRIMRVYDAPVEAVWDAWTDPEQVAKWWGPRGFTLTTHSKDFRGRHLALYDAWSGRRRLPQQDPLSGDHPAKLVYDHGGNDERKPLFRVTVVFSEVGGTKLDMTMRLSTPKRRKPRGRSSRRRAAIRLGIDWQSISKRRRPARKRSSSIARSRAAGDDVRDVDRSAALFEMAAADRVRMQFLRATSGPAAARFTSCRSRHQDVRPVHVPEDRAARSHCLYAAVLRGAGTSDATSDGGEPGLRRC